MKIKSAFVILTAAVGLFMTGCQQQSQPQLNKSQVVKKAQKPFKSGQVKSQMTMDSGAMKESITSTTVFGGKNTVFHTRSHIKMDDSTTGFNSWLAPSGFYLIGKKGWFKTDSEKAMGYNYSDVQYSIVNNPLIQDPNPALVKAYKMQYNPKKKTYTLTANIKDKKILAQVTKNIMGIMSQSRKQSQNFDTWQDMASFKDMKVKAIVANNKLSSFRVVLDVLLNKQAKLHLDQTYSNFGDYEFLQLPAEAGKAKTLNLNGK